MPLGRQLGLMRGLCAGLLSQSSGMSNEEQARALQRDLGRLPWREIVPVDREAVVHAQEHGETMRVESDDENVEDLASRMMEAFGNGVGPPSRLQDCHRRLGNLLDRKSVV